MTVREFLNKNAPVVIICTLIVMTGCLFFVLRSSEVQRPPVIRNTFYFDLETSTLFVGPSDDLPPIPTPSGHKDTNGNNLGVRAVVFSCGKCDDESTHYIGYLETLTPEAREQMSFLRHQAEMGFPVPPGGPGIMPGQRISPTSMPSTSPSTAPMSALTTAPTVVDPMMSGRLISDPKNINWFPMVSEDGGKITSAALSKCGGGKFPTQCFPSQQEK